MKNSLLEQTKEKINNNPFIVVSMGLFIITVSIGQLFDALEKVKSCFSDKTQNKSIGGNEIALQELTNQNDAIVILKLSKQEITQEIHAKENRDFSIKRNQEVDELKKSLETSKLQIEGLIDSVVSYENRIDHLEIQQQILLDNSIYTEETNHLANRKLLKTKTQLTFPLSGFSGKRVIGELWDDTAQTYTIFEEVISPTELLIKDIKPNQWYWLRIKEYDDEAGNWKIVHTSWFSS